MEIKEFTTISDAGSVRVGTDDFTVLIPNGYGDGDTTVIVLDEFGSAPKEANYFTQIKGEKINIYFYDCGSNEVVETLSGCYGCYYFEKTVYLEKWS